MTLPHRNPRPSLRRLLVPLCWPYGRIIDARNARFDRGDDVNRAAVPVISVGNLTTGGTGKTPLVIEISRRLAAMTPQPAILTRGYAAARGNTADEVLEYREALPDIPVVVKADRVAGAQAAVREHHATCLILDDGFQHRRLARDLDIVLIDALDPWGGGRLLPAGNLREPVASLNRAGLIVLTRANQLAESAAAEIVEKIKLRAAKTPIIAANVHATSVSGVRGEPLKPADLAYRSVLPVCGVGNPASFLALVQSHAGQCASPLVFRDHHRYCPRDAAQIRAAAMRGDADLVITTRKDWVKLAPLWAALVEPPAVELVRLDMRLELHDPEDVLGSLLSRVLEAAK